MSQQIENLIKQIFEHIGENPEREGLKETPKRIVKMWSDLFRGYDFKQKPKITVFNNGADGLIYDQMIIDTGNYYSFCEHHMLPFFGQYWFAYVPNPKGKILGLSKVAKIVDYHAAKMQIQERLVSDIVNELWNAINGDNEPIGMALIMKGEHLCKTMRGVKKKGEMTTSYLKGIFQSEMNARNELMQLIK
ncbi:MAG: GTP cyclohydrolase I [archaeon]|nr:GTP cyclohydrolase I [archaeon]